MSLRAERSNPVHNKIKQFGIAASLRLLAMTAGIEFFRGLLNHSCANVPKISAFDHDDRQPIFQALKQDYAYDER